MRYLSALSSSLSLIFLFSPGPSSRPIVKRRGFRDRDNLSTSFRYDPPRQLSLFLTFVKEKSVTFCRSFVVNRQSISSTKGRLTHLVHTNDTRRGSLEMRRPSQRRTQREKENERKKKKRNDGTENISNNSYMNSNNNMNNLYNI